MATEADEMFEVVMSGISCRLPESNNMREFRDHLMKGEDMVTETDRRWQPGLYGLPKRTGTLKDITRFDAGFFGVHARQANMMDPQIRMLLECTCEAIMDAGVNPESIRGSKTGVFVGSGVEECQLAWSADPHNINGYTITGTTKFMFANRISYFFDLQGPSYTVDSACSSSLLALDHALHYIRTGEIDAAIVGGISLCLRPGTSLQFLKLGALSPDGISKCFDEEANGFCRSEGIVAVYLQKKTEAKRIYASVVHSKSNSDGYKQEGITFPSRERQKHLLQSLYNACRLNPADVSYVEPHCTGTQAGDTQEVNAICDVFCKGREKPLLIGSVKSNIGHSEAASGLASVAKIIIAMEENILPANLHFKNPSPNIRGLMNGQLQVVTQNTTFCGGYVGINSFGVGGSNSHVVLKSNTLSKPAQDHPTVKQRRLLVYSARNEEGVKLVMQEVERHKENMEFHALLNETVGLSIESHPYRGYSILNSPGLDTEIQRCNGCVGRDVWYVFSGMGAQWHGMGSQLLYLDTFRDSLEKSASVLEPLGIDLLNLLTGSTKDAFQTTVNAFVGTTAIQIGLVNLMSSVGVKPNGYIGHSLGEIGCAYVDGCLTAEEAVLTAYWRGRCIEDASLPVGAMAAVGLPWHEICEMVPENVVAACHNSEDSVTISGPKKDVLDFVKDMKSRQIFAREVDTNGIAFHSNLMVEAEPALKKVLSKLITPKKRSPKWISSSIPESNWSSDLALYSSADYYVNNLVSPVLFHQALKSISPNAIVVEVAPHSLLQAILKRALGSDCTFLGLMKRDHSDNLGYFLSNLGKMFNNGVNINPLKLYQPISFPVSRGTPMISSLIRWDHSQTWNVPKLEQFISGSANQSGCVFDIDVSPECEFQYLIGHKMDGRIIIPSMGYLVWVWKALAKQKDVEYERLPVIFKNVQFHRATVLSTTGTVRLEVNVMPSSGLFEINERNTLVVSGTINVLEEQIRDTPCIRELGYKQAFCLSSDDVYKELRLRGYEFQRDFKSIVAADVNANHGEVLWTGNWITYLDSLVQMAILARQVKNVCLPTRITTLQVDPRNHPSLAQPHLGQIQVMPVRIEDSTRTCASGCVKLLGLHTTITPRRHDGESNSTVILSHKFLPYRSKPGDIVEDSLQKYLESCSTMAQEVIQRLLKHGNGSDKHDDIIADIALNEDIVWSRLKNQDVGNLSEDGESSLLFMLTALNSPQTMKDCSGISPKRRRELLENLKQDKLLNATSQSAHFKACLDMVIENTLSTIIKVLEVDSSDLSEKIFAHFETCTSADVSYLTTRSSFCNDEAIVEGDVNIWDAKSSSPNKMPKSHLVIARNLLHRATNIEVVLTSLLSAVEENGFMLVQEITNNFHVHLPVLFHTYGIPRVEDKGQRTQGCYCNCGRLIDIIRGLGLEIVYEGGDGLMSSFFLVRKTALASPSHQVLLNIGELDFGWVEELKSKLVECQNKPKGCNLWLKADCNESGILGLTKCLRKEPDTERIRCIFMDGSDVNSELTEDFQKSEVFMDLVRKDLVMNVHRDGQWGSYGYLPVDKNDSTMKSSYAYLDILSRGDLTSIKWIASPKLRLKHAEAQYKQECRVCYSALNFRDVMVATGRLPVEALPIDLCTTSSLLGIEFSGIDFQGRRVMGLVPAMGLATEVAAHNDAVWEVPSTWTLEQAATVPVIYATAYYALVVRGNIRHGDHVLIHSGSGGVGHAAITIALHYGCEVYTTVGSEHKKRNLQRIFPQLKFSSSRGTSFEHDIMTSTNGRGVDIILNSLAGEQLQSSLRVLAKHGRFLEIGKYDLSKNTALGMSLFLKNVTFSGILLDALFEPNNPELKQVSTLVSEGIKTGVVKPIPATVFERTEAEAALRYMAQGKYSGKIVIKIREPLLLGSSLQALKRCVCHPAKTYIITGGLGGVGLELTHWLIDRGAKHFVLTSRSRIRLETGYIKRKLQWFDRLGVEVVISNRDVCKMEDTKLLLEESSRIRPVGGVFHLAMVLDDALMINQTEEKFRKVCDVKVNGIRNLDAVTRDQCKESLDWFVAFSTIISGNGSAGATNYGYANSFMERVCEKRVADGLSGLAFQVGAISDVGIMVDTLGDEVTSLLGTIPQSVVWYLDKLDLYLNQPQPIVCHFIPSKTPRGVNAEGRMDLIDAVNIIIGINESESLDPATSLADLGLDSLMGVEVKQTLERGWGLEMTMTEIRSLTLTKLRALAVGGTTK